MIPGPTSFISTERYFESLKEAIVFCEEKTQDSKGSKWYYCWERNGFYMTGYLEGHFLPEPYRIPIKEKD